MRDWKVSNPAVAGRKDGFSSLGSGIGIGKKNLEFENFKHPLHTEKRAFLPGNTKKKFRFEKKTNRRFPFFRQGHSTYSI